MVVEKVKNGRMSISNIENRVPTAWSGIISFAVIACHGVLE
jgi:hypothetical protein